MPTDPEGSAGSSLKIKGQHIIYLSVVTPMLSDQYFGSLTITAFLTWFLLELSVNVATRTSRRCLRRTQMFHINIQDLQSLHAIYFGGLLYLPHATTQATAMWTISRSMGTRARINTTVFMSPLLYDQRWIHQPLR